MKAALHHRWGGPDAVELAEVEKPVPAEGEVLVRVAAAGVNPYDWHFLRGSPYFMRLIFGLFSPAEKHRRLGADVAGTVEGAGSGFHAGDQVFGQVTLGSFAEYVAVPASQLAPKPENLTFTQAAAVPLAALTALQGLRDVGAIQSGQQVLINGAAGGIGTFAVQLAKAFGASVTGVCSAANVEMVRSLGADHVIDYTRADFISGDRRYDLMVDNIGNRSIADCRRVLTPAATYVAVGGLRSGGSLLGPAVQVIKAEATSPFVSQRMARVAEKPNAADLLVLRELIEAGDVTPVIDRTFPLAETADAIGYVETGHARGKVVITIS